MDPGRYAAGIATRLAKRAGNATFGFQEAKRAGTIIRHPSTNRWTMVAATLTGSTGTIGTNPPMKDRPRTRPSPRLWTPRNAAIACESPRKATTPARRPQAASRRFSTMDRRLYSRMAASGMAPNAMARRARSGTAAPSAFPLRQPHRADVVGGREDEDHAEPAQHDGRDERDGARYGQNDGRTSEDREVPRHRVLVEAAPVRPIPAPIRDERPTVDRRRAAEVRGLRFGGIDEEIVVVVKEPGVTRRRVGRTEGEIHSGTPEEDEPRSRICHPRARESPARGRVPIEDKLDGPWLDLDRDRAVHRGRVVATPVRPIPAPIRDERPVPERRATAEVRGTRLARTRLEVVVIVDEPVVGNAAVRGEQGEVDHVPPVHRDVRSRGRDVRGAESPARAGISVQGEVHGPDSGPGGKTRGGHPELRPRRPGIDGNEKGRRNDGEDKTCQGGVATPRHQVDSPSVSCPPQATTWRVAVIE